MQCYDFLGALGEFSGGGQAFRLLSSMQQISIERESKQRRPCVRCRPEHVCVCGMARMVCGKLEGMALHHSDKAFTDSAKQCGLHPVATERPAMFLH